MIVNVVMLSDSIRSVDEAAIATKDKMTIHLNVNWYKSKKKVTCYVKCRF